MMNDRAVLTCEAEGNPAPKYQWLQKTPTQQVQKRGFDKTLVIPSVSYDDQGEFVCEAVNSIGGELRPVQSESIRVRVSGAPQVMRLRAEREVQVAVGQKARLGVTFCADPPPKQAWHLRGGGGAAGGAGGGANSGQHSVILAAGTSHSRFTAEQAERSPDGRDNCYESVLTIDGAHPQDARDYLLELTNRHGTDRHVVRLVVRSE